MWHQREGEKEFGHVGSEETKSGDNSSCVPTLSRQLCADLSRRTLLVLQIVCASEVVLVL